MQQHNLDYLYSIDENLGNRVADYLDGNNTDEETGDIVAAIEQYEQDGNEWWLSDDPNVYGYYQLFEPRLLMDWSKFQEAVEGLAKRPVFTHEFGIEESVRVLKEEAERAREELGYF